MNSNPPLLPSEAIAFRNLAISDNTGKIVSSISIYIGKPWLDDRCWTCYWRVMGLGDDDTYKISGIDGFQAINGAFAVINNGILMASEAYQQGLICWEEGSKWEPEAYQSFH
jgi:hypothetical protein